MKDQRVKDSTSVILEIFIQDNSVTTGAGLTGLVHDSASLTCYYHRNTAAAAAAVTLVDMTVGTFTSSGFKAVDGTNMPGVYQLCLPNAAFVTGADSVSVLLKGAANMAPVVLEIRLTGVDWTDAVRAGLTALPNAAAAANGGLPTGDANAAVKVQTGTGTGQLDFTSGVVKGNVVQLGGVVQSLTDLKDFADDGYDPATNRVQGVVLTDTLTTYTGNTPQTGDSYAKVDTEVASILALIGTPVTDLAADIAAIEAQTDDIGAAGAGLTALASAASIAALNNLSAAQVNTEMDTAIADARLDELLAADSDIDGAAPPAVGSVFHELLSKTVGSFTYDQTTDSLEAVRDRGDAAWITATGFSTLSQADIRAALGMGSANLDTQLDTLPTAAEVATAVWSEGTRTLTAISATLRNQIADNVIRRTFANAAASADGDAKTGRSLLGAIARLVNRSAIAAGTLTVYEADDVTALFTQTLTTDAAAEPVIEGNTD